MIMKHPKVLCAIMLFVCHLLGQVRAGACPGCVDLDEINFDKTISRFPQALIKFDIAFPYGQKHEEFGHFAREAYKVVDDLLVATVGIKDYGEMENKLLGDRYNVDDKKFPAILLFTGSPQEFIKFPDHLDVTLDNLKAFVTKNTELYIGQEGCIKLLNDLAHKYVNLNYEEQQQKLKDAKLISEQLQSAHDQVNAKFYLVFMEKINKLGYTFVEEETKRLLRLKAGKVTEEKKNELRRKLNILDIFRVTKLTKASDIEQLEGAGEAEVLTSIKDDL